MQGARRAHIHWPRLNRRATLHDGMHRLPNAVVVPGRDTNLHLSPTLCCIVGYVGACSVTLGRPPQRISPDTPPVASVASLAYTTLSAGSRRQPVRDAG
jgi:hypothetical protein